jgi:secreted trypsin-like serine protease
MPRRLALLALVLLLVPPASDGFGARAVVGGTPIPVSTAPWSVLVRQTTGTSGILQCTGAVLDSLHVLTAGHCTFDQSGNVAAPAALSIRAGISNFVTPGADDAEQDRGVSSFRVHPGFAWSPRAAADDVAILALSAPLDLSTTLVQAAPLPSGGAFYPARGSDVSLAAFGRESAGNSPDGSLQAFTATVDDQGRCGGTPNGVVANSSAVAYCVSTPAGATCNGDSGGALVTTDPSHTVVGIVSAGPGGCAPGSHGVFTNVQAPEILDFIRGNDHPATAPRVTGATYVKMGGQEAQLLPGSTVTCMSGGWDGAPTLAYAFLDVRTGDVIQQGPNGSMLVPPARAGDLIRCRAIATNAGGSSVLDSITVEQVADVEPLTIERLPAATAKRGHVTRIGIWLDTPIGVTGRYGVCMTPPPHVAPRACASKHIAGSGGGRIQLTITLHVANVAPLGTARLAVAAAAGPSRSRATALLHIVA